MNLKSAARALGVHYQTAYRYVRAGDLVAVRVGNGYEISDSAVEMLRSKLDAQGHVIHAVPPPAAPAASLEDELALVVDATTLSARPAFELITRWLAEEFGDTSTVLLATHGRSLLCAASFDRDAQRRAIVDAMLSASMMKVSPTFGAAALRTATTEVVHHVPVAAAMEFVPGQFREFADRLLVQSYIAAPLITGDGRTRGVLMVVRFLGGPPYTAEVVAVVERLARSASRAHDRARHYSAAWVGRENLHSSLQQLAAMDLDAAVDDVADTVIGLLTPGIPEAVYSPDHRLVAGNAAFMERRCAPEMDPETWQRLVVGPVDYATTPDGCHTDSTAQWGVVRRPDGTPYAVVVVGEPPDEVPAFPELAIAVPGVAAR